MRETFTVLHSPALVLPVPNLDTDQIVPARFLTTTTRAGLGAVAFADWRARPGSPFADPRAASCRVLVAGDNFGCGSSREHAAWALRDFGFRAVVSTSFADIFRANALKNGVLPVAIDPDLHAALCGASWPEVTVDLQRSACTAMGRVVPFVVPAFERDCLLHGRDELDQLLLRLPAIEAFEGGRR